MIIISIKYSGRHAWTGHFELFSGAFHNLVRLLREVRVTSSSSPTRKRSNLIVIKWYIHERTNELIFGSVSSQPPNSNS